MRLLEYQAKIVLGDYGLAVPRGKVIQEIASLPDAVAYLGGAVAIKAQIPVGGRGRANGIRLCSSLPEAEEATATMLGSSLKGHRVEDVLVEERLDIRDEYYMAVLMDSGAARPLVMFSTRGGVDIENVASENPGAVIRAHVDPLFGLTDYQARFVVNRVGVDRSLIAPLSRWLKLLYQIYWEMDALLVEVNPLVVTGTGEIVAADARVVIDDNALFRQPKIRFWRRISADEARAEEAHINYIWLDGTIGIIGSGAGMAMANMDQVAYFGGSPGSFIDVGPGMNTGGGRAAMDILLERPDLKAILISGYTGSRLEILAQDIISALDAHPKTAIPIVVRLEGTNDQQALEMLRRCAYSNLHLVPGFDRAASVAVELSRQSEQAVRLPGGAA